MRSLRLLFLVLLLLLVLLLTLSFSVFSSSGRVSFSIEKMVHVVRVHTKGLSAVVVVAKVSEDFSLQGAQEVFIDPLHLCRLAPEGALLLDRAWNRFGNETARKRKKEGSKHTAALERQEG